MVASHHDGLQIFDLGQKRIYTAASAIKVSEL
jgi:hypothetical protein